MQSIKIGDIIRNLRGSKGISQETLADACGVSMQAVSKWENGQSYPDITLLPVLSDYFHVTLDYLLTGEYPSPCAESVGDEDRRIIEALQNRTKPDTLYIVQYQNGKVLDKTAFDQDADRFRQPPVKIRFEEALQNSKNNLHVEFWGNAMVEGDVGGSVNTGGTLTCTDVNGSVDAGGDVTCADVNGTVSAGGSVACADVNGSVTAGSTVHCADVGGNVSAGNNVTCNDVDGKVTANGAVTCTGANYDMSAENSVQ